jgi:carbamoyl-phosphate synthase large subunit
MPRRDDLHTILVIGAGPIVIGQGCEFDYSGTQACKALREEGYRVVLVNSNPATIMTDPAYADRTYIEPITVEAVEKVIELEASRGTPVDALIPTLGGQTALNCGCALHDAGILERHGVEMIGADRATIYRAEDRDAFRTICEEIGLKLPNARSVSTYEDARTFLDEIGLPAIIRPAFTLGGIGGGIAYNHEEFEDIVRRGLSASMIGQVQIDQSILGWKEYELEVVRDKHDNCVIVCGIENIDAVGVHTGDSITVAPIQTLSDKEYQRMRDASIAILRAVGVETGGSNVQFAVNPVDGEMVVIEMNPRVSRSSALASKATGFPIAKIAAKLAIGYTLDELRNDITGTTSACFEPSIDYVVTKLPRWTFEKFPEADETLTTQMKSVGEAMAIGRTFAESLQKGIRSMEVKRYGLGLDQNDRWLRARRAEHVEDTPSPDTVDPDVEPDWPIPERKLLRKLSVPSQGRLFYLRYAMRAGMSDAQIHDLTGIDPWFLDQIRQIVEFEDEILAVERLEDAPAELIFEAKRLGFSDVQLAMAWIGRADLESVLSVRRRRQELRIEPVYKLVDTCAAEFEAITPYYYSAYEPPLERITEDGRAEVLEPDDEIRVGDRPKVIILGGGPNRIGQGIEFDYCCCQAAFAAKDLGFESVMINSNPETVSTDYDTSDLLFFEPLTLEDVLNIIERLNGGGIHVPERSGGVVGVNVQFGGQTPLNLARGLVTMGVPLMGTSLDSIDLAEDRDRFSEVLRELDLKQPESGIARSVDEAVTIAGRIGYPVLVRPSYVLGGRGMEICSDESALRQYMRIAVGASDLDEQPVLIDCFLAEATEIDVDVAADFAPAPRIPEAGRSFVDANLGSGDEPRAIVCGVMEHIEEAGIHSGDSACTIPPLHLPVEIVQQVRDTARALARRLKVRGLMNVQLAVKDGEVFVIEVNPRASRTVPFVAKAKGVPWSRIAARVMMGDSLARWERENPAQAERSSDPKVGTRAPYTAVKEPVFPFERFPGVDIVLGPEMRSTGEVMGIHRSGPVALAKAKMAAGVVLPTEGNVFLSVRELDKHLAPDLARHLASMGFHIWTTGGTGQMLLEHGIQSNLVRKIVEGARPNILDKLANGEIDLIINTPTRRGSESDEGRIRAMAVRTGVPIITTITGAQAAVQAIAALRAGAWSVAAMQDYFPDLARPLPVRAETALAGG